MASTMATPEDFLSDAFLLTNGGTETTLLYRYNCPLRSHAAYELLFSDHWITRIRTMHYAFADVAIKYDIPLLLDMITWRASTHWYDVLETPVLQQAQVHPLALNLAQDVADYASAQTGKNARARVLIHGVIGPRRDAYVHDAMLTLAQARAYHRPQIVELCQIGVQVVGAYTLTTSVEAAGIAAEASAAGLACLISFTVNTDGRLPSGEQLGDAVAVVDAAAQPRPLFFMVNCSHPRHVRKAVEQGATEDTTWIQRIRGIRGNASAKSHAELDERAELDEGDAVEWSREMVSLRDILPNLKIFGGCCGTGLDHCMQVGQLIASAQ